MLLKPITINSRQDYESVVKHYPTHSDFNFTSALSWNFTEDSYYLKLPNDSMVIQLADYHSRKPMVSFLANQHIVSTGLDLFEWMRTEKLGEELRLIPDFMVSHFKDSDKFIVSEDRDNYDYLLSAERLSTMAGKDLHTKLARAEKFAKENDYRVIELDIRKDEDQTRILECFSSWIGIRNLTHDETMDELLAIKRCLEWSEVLPVQAIGVEVEDQLAGFLIYEIEQDDNSCIWHFEKTLTTFSGISEFIKRAVAQKLVAQGIETINQEQDLGIEGLRRAKESYRPVGFREKYTIRLRENR